jgi:hypothetical protein
MLSIPQPISSSPPGHCFSPSHTYSNGRQKLFRHFTVFGGHMKSPEMFIKLIPVYTCIYTDE